MIEIKLVIISSYSYGAPEVSSYGAPEPAYAEPVVEEYSAPAYTAEGEVLDIGSLVLPILVIVGELVVINGIRGPFSNDVTMIALFLLFPNYINLTTVRRSFNDNGPIALLDQVKDVAQAVLEDKNILTKYD